MISRDRHGAAVASTPTGEDPCCTGAGCTSGAPLQRGDEWLTAARTARILSWVSLVWMSGEGVLGLIAGATSGSISLI
ncbi:MAG TPA: hypothetical protein VHN80_33005, partial [Kineosporiaceae bacterium]|nr:hypothetical protein [Kineosporiaceae bacterium]